VLWIQPEQAVGKMQRRAPKNTFIQREKRVDFRKQKISSVSWAADCVGLALLSPFLTFLSKSFQQKRY
jgi:hypothetical protein